jgi:acetyl-CoA carboxylase carboxyl transferase subunit alpha
VEPVLPFERPIDESDRSLRHLAWRVRQEGIAAVAAYQEELARRDERIRRVHAGLTPWQRVQLARHPERPHGEETAAALFGRLEPLHGDRAGGDDPAITTGIGLWREQPIVVIACERGRGRHETHRRNFGMPSPAGFRKAQRALDLAERWGYPVVSLVDTPGAWPGLESERFGIAEAISRTLARQATVRTATLGVVLGEGGSGGALALAMGDRILMMQYAYFSVISPEACASILWRDGARTPAAAEALRLLPEDLLGLGLVDGVVPEPFGGAHRHRSEAICLLREHVDAALVDLLALDPVDRLAARRARYRDMGRHAVAEA